MKVQIPRFGQVAIGAARALGGRPLVVGGTVRDAIMGVSPKDCDIEIHGMSEETFRGAFATTLATIGRVDAVGVSFGVLKFGHDVEISLPRRERKTGDGHQGFEIAVDTTLTITEALERRDLTIGAMAVDPITGEFFDPFDGEGDIARKLIRHVGPRFAEDPLRVMRVVRFAAVLGFDVHPETAELCQSLLRELRGMAKERLWGEWERILTKGVDFSAMHRALWVTGVDQLQPGATIRDVFVVHHPDHVAHETRIAARFAHSDERAAAILGKWALSCAGGKPGSDEVTELFAALDVPHDLRRTARKFRDGMIFVSAWNGGHWSASDARHFARELAPVSLRSVCRASGRSKEAARVFAAAKAAGVLHEPHKPLLDGHALMELGMEPGPQFGAILKAALAAQDRGVFTTRDEGMALVQEKRFG